MSVDAQRFMDIMTYLNIIWSGPFQIIVALVFLWRILGPSVLVGMSFMGILVPLNAFIGKQLKKLQVHSGVFAFILRSQFYYFWNLLNEVSSVFLV